jgi:hypothetical protein
MAISYLFPLCTTQSLHHLRHWACSSKLEFTTVQISIMHFASHVPANARHRPKCNGVIRHVEADQT